MRRSGWEGEGDGGRGKLKGRRTVAKDLDPYAVDAAAVDCVRVRVADAEHGRTGAETVEVEGVVFCLVGGVVEGGCCCCCGGWRGVGGGECGIGGWAEGVGEERLCEFGGEERRAEEGALVG